MNAPPLAVALALTLPALGQEAHDHDHAEPALSDSDGWLDPWPHSHFSRGGTPFVHLFGGEPAFIGNDLLFDFEYLNGDEEDEYEVEFELELALTRRIGLAIEAPYVFLDPDDGDSENGIGDVGIIPRFLLVDEDRFLLSANVGVELPTGDDDKDLGSGETSIVGSLATWIDLGNDFTLQTRIGLEHGFDEHEEVLVWGAGVTYSVYTKQTPAADAAHFPEGMLNLIAEIAGEHTLDGEEEGRGTAELIFGAAYSLSPTFELRAAFTVPAWDPREFDRGVILGFIWHF